jgi:dihydroorotate dehydrogenase
MYRLIRKLLFLLDAEAAHNFALAALSMLDRFGLVRLFAGRPVYAPRTVMNIEFPNAVGLAAGLDKNAEHIDALRHCGFGFIEVGTVTPVAQPGNDKPRLFRLEADEAIINRMGFNNLGVDALVEQVRKIKTNGVLGINIGKNKVTPLENAVDDYLVCMEKVYPLADYITINISSPNTPGLRELQHGEGLSRLLDQLKRKQHELEQQYKRYVPLAVKIAPDLTSEELADIAKRVLESAVDAVIATNTTNARPSLKSTHSVDETGGLSGRPVFDLSTCIVKQLVELLQGHIPVIAVGGISSAEQAVAKIRAGADLVQIYTGFIYRGPRLVRQCAMAIKTLDQ